MSKVIVLRPEPGASATLARAKAEGIDAIAIPLFEVAPVAWAAPDAGAHDALLLTSANAVRNGGNGLAALSGLPAYCVGEATASAARVAGFRVALVGDRDAAALIAQLPDGLRLLHLTGVEHRPIASVTQVAVYHNRTVHPPPSLDALRSGVAMVHSPRAGARLGELINQRGSIAIAAISRVAADACGEGWRTVAAIDAPTDGALLALAGKLWQGRPR